MSLIPNPVSDFLEANRSLLIYAAIILAVIALCTLSYCAGGAGETIKSQDGTIKVQAQVIAADGNAADARVGDTVKIANQQREIEDAVENTSGVDDARRARGCVVLSQQGRDTSRIAACR